MSTEVVTKEENNQELKEVLVSVQRVAKVVRGGRRFGFSALVVVGDGAGRVGYGLGKAKEVGEARTKATNEARKSMRRVPLREGRTLHHDIHVSYGAGSVILRSAPRGTGIIAGGPMRAIFDCLGISDIVAKSTGSNNSNIMVHTTFKALSKIKSPKIIAERRDMKVSEIIERREGQIAKEEKNEE